MGAESEAKLIADFALIASIAPLPCSAGNAPPGLIIHKEDML